MIFRKQLYIVLGTFIILFYSCRSTGKNEVVFETATMNELTDLIDHIQAVRLEHGDSIFIGRNPFIFQRDSSFYLFDKSAQKKIYRFTLDGRFMNTIGKVGTGPGEYPDINQVIIDEKEDDVLMLSYSSYLYRYAKNGQFKERINKTDIQIQSFIRIDSVLWLHALNVNSDTIYILKSNLRLEVSDTLKLVQPGTKDRAVHRPYSLPLYFRFIDHKVCFAVSPYPQINEIDENRVQEKIRFRFVPEEYASKRDLETIGLRELFDFKKLQFLVDFYENEDYLFVYFQCGGHKTGGNLILAVQEKSTGKWRWLDEKVSVPDFNQYHWYTGRICGMGKDGGLMCYIPTPQPLEAYKAVKQLIVNPELFSSVDEEMDMYIFMCYLKPPYLLGQK